MLFIKETQKFFHSSCILPPAEILRISSCALTLRGSREVPVPWWSCTRHGHGGAGWSCQQRKGLVGLEVKTPKKLPSKDNNSSSPPKSQKWEMEEAAEPINTPVTSTLARRSSLSLPHALAERYLTSPSWRYPSGPSHCIPRRLWHSATG